jgi:hypothetical protein
MTFRPWLDNPRRLPAERVENSNLAVNEYHQEIVSFNSASLEDFDRSFNPPVVPGTYEFRNYIVENHNVRETCEFLSRDSSLKSYFKKYKIGYPERTFLCMVRICKQIIRELIEKYLRLPVLEEQVYVLHNSPLPIVSDLGLALGRPSISMDGITKIITSQVVELRVIRRLTKHTSFIKRNEVTENS